MGKAARVALGVVLAARAALAGDVQDAAAALSRAFREERPAELRTLLAGKRKVLVSVPCLEADGFLGADQLFYLLEEFFAHHGTRLFRVDRTGAEAGAATAFVRAEWSYEDERGRVHSVPLLATLARERDRWVLTEIRAARD